MTFSALVNYVAMFKTVSEILYIKYILKSIEEEVKLNIKEFIEKWKIKNINRINQMYISEIKIIE